MSTEIHSHHITREVHAAYWSRRLSGDLPILKLPLDYPRPPVSSFVREREHVYLGRELHQRLLRFSTQHDVSTFAVLLAAFKILLYRYTGENDIIVGAIPPGLPCQETFEGEVHAGISSPVALRTNVSGRPIVNQLISRVAETVREAIAHGQYPIRAVLQKLDNDNRRESLPFRVMFDMEEQQEEISADGKSESPSNLFQELGVRCDFILKILTQKQFAVEIEYDAELFEPATIQRVALHYHTLLDGLLNHPGLGILQVPFLTDSERHQQLVDWNTTTTTYSAEPCVHQFFEVQVAERPESTAIVCGDEQVTYEALNRKVNQMTDFLLRHGVGPEVRVAFCLERSINLPVALLGILKAGGVYVPLDPSTPLDRTTFILTDAQVRLVLTQSSLLKQFQTQSPLIDVESPWQPRWIAMDDPSVAFDSCHTSDPSPIVSAENLAYIIYTSGSTGHPKGVAITQGNLSEFVQCASNYLAIEPGDRILQFASPAFDASVEEIFPCLLRGGTLVLRPEDMIETVSTFWDTVNRLQLTVLDLPTAYWHELTNALSAQPGSLAHCVRLVVIGGEQARTDQLTIWHQQMPSHLKLLNTYGPTEATVVAAWEDLSTTSIQEERKPTATVSIGHPLENRSIYILDAYLRPMPIGVPGELYLGGRGLGRGYDHLPQLTAEAFIPDPFSPHYGARLYRTGDRGRYRTDGTIELLGRMDQQIKIRGYRVELQEIESCLRQIPEIQDGVVIQSYEQGHTSLTAYVVSHNHLPLSTPSIRQVLQRELPHFMVPAGIIHLEELPRLPSGKINRKALSSRSQVFPVKDMMGRGPETAVEESLVNVWKELLHLPSVNVQDNFFEVGGHSLLATRLLVKLREIWQSDFPLRILFDHPVLEDQALLIEEYLLREIEELSEEDLQNLLKGKGSQ